MRKMMVVSCTTLLAYLVTGCVGKTPVNPKKQQKASTNLTPKAPQSTPGSLLPPLYLTFISHNEEPGEIHPDYLADRAFYLRNRENVRQLVIMLKSKGAMLNFQSDWNFLKAVAEFDKDELLANTNGKNIVRWLVEDLGLEADPHAHETLYNYSDVAYLHTLLGVKPSQNVGGFLFDPPDNQQGWEQHISGVSGKVYPDAFWKPDILWGAATFGHRGNDECSYGVWRPQNRYNFTLHDPNQRLINIGGGCISSYGLPEVGMDGVRKMLDAITNQDVPMDGFYTATIFIPQALIDTKMIQVIEKDLDWLESYVREGRVIWSSLTQTAQIWKTSYGGKPFRLDCSQIPKE
jgi:hypothetical protein